MGGIEVKTPDRIASAFDLAFSADRPVVVDAHCDPNVPPLPPHISFEQAKGYMFSIFKGDPNAIGAVKQTVKDMMSKLTAKVRS